MPEPWGFVDYAHSRISVFNTDVIIIVVYLAGLAGIGLNGGFGRC